MPKIYHTFDMEAAIVAAHAKTPRNLVYCVYQCFRPIRLRWPELLQIGPSIYKPWKPEYAGVLPDWQSNGGTLIYQPRLNKGIDSPPECHTFTYSEAPLSIKTYERHAPNVRGEMIFYYPPTWELHNETIRYKYPTSDLFVTMQAFARALVGRELPDDQATLLRKSGMPVASTAVFTASDVRSIMGITERQLRSFMRWRMRYCGTRWHIYQTILPPDDPDLLHHYRIVEAQPEIAVDEYALRLDQPLGDRVPLFARYLKTLEKQNYISRLPCIYLIDVEKFKFECDKVDSDANVYRSRWHQMRSLIEDSEEYPL